MIHRVARGHGSVEVNEINIVDAHKHRVANRDGRTRPENDGLDERRHNANEVHELQGDGQHTVDAVTLVRLTGYHVMYLATSMESFPALSFSAKPTSAPESDERGLSTNDIQMNRPIDVNAATMI